MTIDQHVTSVQAHYISLCEFYEIKENCMQEEMQKTKNFK